MVKNQISYLGICLSILYIVFWAFIVINHQSYAYASLPLIAVNWFLQLLSGNLTISEINIYLAIYYLVINTILFYFLGSFIHRSLIKLKTHT